MDAEPQLDPSEQPASHEVTSWMTGAQLTAGFGLGHRLAVETQLPVRVTVIEAAFADAQGRALDIESIHHRDETIAGIGDLRLALRVAAVRPMDVKGLSVDLRLGVSFPTGHVEDDPYALAARGLSHTHTFFGAGNVLPQLGVDVAFETPGGSLTVGLDGQIGVGEGEKGYEAPSFGTFGLGWRTGFGVPGLTMQFRHELYVESPAYWDGVKAENSGRTDLQLSLAAYGDVGDGLSVGGMLRVPYLTLTDGAQYESPLLLSLSLSWTRDLIDDP